MKNLKEVTIYTKSNCPYCDATRKLLDWNEIDYIEIDINKISKRNFKDTVLFEGEHLPKIFIDDELIGSYQQLVEYIAKEKLKGGT